MMLDQLTRNRPEADTEPADPILPVLIRVPSLDRPPAGRRRPSARRRLRREVRMAGSSLIMATPLAWALMMMGGSEPEPPIGVTARLIGIEGLGASVAVADEAPRITTTAGPTATATATEPEAAAGIGSAVARRKRVPVVLPGYLLPMDGNEEPAHAGG